MDIKLHHLSNAHDMTFVTNYLGKIAPRGVCIIEPANQIGGVTADQFRERIWFKNIPDILLERFVEGDHEGLEFAYVVRAEDEIENPHWDDGGSRRRRLPLSCVFVSYDMLGKSPEVLAFEEIVLKGILSAKVMGLGEDKMVIPLCANPLLNLNPDKHKTRVLAAIRDYREALKRLRLNQDEVHFLCSDDQYPSWNAIFSEV